MSMLHGRLEAHDAKDSRRSSDAPYSAQPSEPKAIDIRRIDPINVASPSQKNAAQRYYRQMI